MRRWVICFFINLFVCLAAYGQQNVDAKPFTSPVIRKNFMPFSMAKTDTANYEKRSFLRVPVTVIPPDYYTGTIGFFCKKELQLEKAVKFPLKFRLGSVAYTDKMEGKGMGSTAPYNK